MRLMWRSRRQPPTVPDAEALRKATAAVEESQRALAASTRRIPEVRSLGQQLRELREENNFSLRLQWMLRESGGGHHDRS